jgi:hypothetical protein
MELGFVTITSVRIAVPTAAGLRSACITGVRIAVTTAVEPKSVNSVSTARARNAVRSVPRFGEL